MLSKKQSDPESANETCVILAEGNVTVVCVDAKRFKPKRIPKQIFETIEGL
jgi:acyl-CoA thioesterase FadM